jgi:hypothetical protein
VFINISGNNYQTTVNPTNITGNTKVNVAGGYNPIQVSSTNLNGYIPDNISLTQTQDQLNQAEIEVLKGLIQIYQETTKLMAVAGEAGSVGAVVDSSTDSTPITGSVQINIQKCQQAIGTSISDIMAILAELLEKSGDSDANKDLLTCLQSVAKDGLKLGVIIHDLKVAIAEAKAKLANDNQPKHPAVQGLFAIIVGALVGGIPGALLGAFAPDVLNKVLGLGTDAKDTTISPEDEKQLEQLLKDAEEALKCLTELIDLILQLLNAQHPNGTIPPSDEHPNGLIPPAVGESAGTIPSDK